MSSDPQPTEQQYQQVRQFLAWLLPVAVCVAALLQLVAFFYPFRGTWIASIAIGFYGLLLLWSRAQLARGSIQQTVATICLGLFALALLVTYTVPSAAQVLILLPFMAICVALP